MNGAPPRALGRSAPAALALGIAGAPELVFQPAVDLDSGRILGFEALLRWSAPDGAIIWPSQLIPWAEAAGHMEALNAWIVGEACAQALRWPSHLQVAVNCSTTQLHRREAALAAANALEASGLLPDRLTVEVPETTVASEGALADLRAMARLGVQLTIDDVDSMPAPLDELPARTVGTMKIDGSVVQGLVADPACRMVATTVIEFARALGICTVAECVETHEQLAVLQTLGADVAQGHLFSPPLSAEDACTLANLTPPADFLDVLTSTRPRGVETRREARHRRNLVAVATALSDTSALVRELNSMLDACLADGRGERRGDASAAEQA